MISALAAVVAALASAAVVAQPRPAFPVEALDRFIEALHDRHHFSGAVVIERDGAVVYARGIGLANAATSASFTPETPTNAAGLAKPFTAATVLLLEEAGVLDLDSPVRRYLKEYPDDTTKVFHAVAQRAALPDYEAYTALFAAGKPVTTAAMIEEAQRVQPAGPPPPALRVRGCDLCLDTAALVVERATNRPFEHSLRERVLQRLGTERAFLRQPRLAALPADRAIGYRIVDGKREAYDALDFEAFHGGRNLYASARDLARFARAFAAPANHTAAAVPKKALWPLVSHGDLISVLTLGNWYCTRDVQRCYAAAAHRGFSNAMYFDRGQKLVVVLVSNTSLPAWLLPRVTRELVVTAEGRLPAMPVEPRLATITPESYRAAAGTYDVPGAGPVTLFEVDGKPHLRAGIGGVEYVLEQVSPKLLYAAGVDATIGIGEDGRLSWATAFIDSYGTKQR